MNIRKSKGLQGEIYVAADKSISHRGVMIGAIAKGTTHITNFLTGDDCLSTIACFRAMGVDITLDKTSVTLFGRGMRGLKEPTGILDAGNSGTTTRLLCGLLSAQNFTSTITGDQSIQKRPMDRVMTPLGKMGAYITGVNGGYAPLTVRGGPLNGIAYTLPVASAQLKSALIFAGIYAQGQTEITEPKVSRNHTELMINGFGGAIKRVEDTIIVPQIEQLYGCELNVPGDISSAAFFMVAGLIVKNACIVMKNVGLNPTRTGIIDVLKAMGGDITIENYQNNMEPVGDVIVKSSDLCGITIGGEMIGRLIDELPVIAVAAAFATGQTIIKDAQELKVKETNRIDAMETELKKAGVLCTATTDGLVIDGGKTVKGGAFSTYHDHRMAMAMSVLALAAKGESTILNPECITISYPDFFETMKKLEV